MKKLIYILLIISYPVFGQIYRVGDKPEIKVIGNISSGSSSFTSVGDQYMSFSVNTGINEIYNNIYQGTGAVNFTYTGLADQKIPAGENGKVYFTHDTDSGVCIMGFNTTYENVNYTGYEYGVFASGATSVSRVTNGTINSLTGQVIAGTNLVGLQRSNDTMYVIKSVDSGATWIKLYTFATLYSGDLYPSITLRSTGPYVMKYPYIDLESSYLYNPNTNYILFVNGQSNAVGNNAESTLFDTLQNNGINKIWWETSFGNQATGSFQNMNVPTNTSGHPSYAASDSVGWSVEQIVSNYFQNLFGDTISTAKFALGSRAIDQWETDAYMYTNMERFINGALSDASMANNTVLANVWIQGEQDVFDGTHLTYGAELDTLLTNFRAIDADLTNARWINVKLKTTASLGASAGTRIPVINTAFDDLAANRTNVFNISTEDVQMKWDNIHYRYDGIYQISHDIINIILSEIKE